MKNRDIGYIILFGMIIGGCIWAFIYAEIITKNFKKRLLYESLNKKEATMQNLLITETKDGEKNWELFAEKGYYDSENHVAILNDIVGNFYKDGEVTASFESAKGSYNEIKKQIILYEKILIVYKDGSNVSANNIIWSGRGTDVIAEGKVRLELPSGIVVKGSKAILNGDFSNLKIKGRTKTEIYDKGKIKI